MKPTEINIFDRRYIQCQYFSHFRFEDGKRRMDMPFWVRCAESGVVHLIQYHISNETEVKWLMSLIEDGMVYMRSIDHALTLPNAEKLNEKTTQHA